MKAIITKEELERAYKQIYACPCCGSTEPTHMCSCSPEVFENRPTTTEVEVQVSYIPPINLTP